MIVFKGTELNMTCDVSALTASHHCNMDVRYIFCHPGAVHWVQNLSWCLVMKWHVCMFICN